jgi:tetratricopeptide (TPR) repeat protein
MQDAVNGYRAASDRSAEMVGALNDLADAMAQSGRADESAKVQEEAQAMAKDLKNENLHAQLLNTQGDLQAYRGDIKAARELYDQAQRAASRGADRDLQMISKLNVSGVAVADGHAPSAARDLRALAQQADNLNMKYLALESSIEMAQAMVDSKDYSHALQELQGELGKSEKLGTRYQTARIQFLLGNALRLSGNTADATGHYRETLSLLDDLKKEPGAEKLLQRQDIKAMYDESTRSSGGGKS